MQVRLQYSNVVVVIDAATIHGVEEEPMNRLPIKLTAGTFKHRLNNSRASTQVGWRELIELGPTMRDELSPLLHHCVEPRQNKEQLRARHVAFG